MTFDIMNHYYDGHISIRLLSSVILLILFYTFIIFIIIKHSNFKHLFLQKHGWHHRITGLSLFLWLLVGIILVFIAIHHHHHKLSFPYPFTCLLYDIILSILGTSTTITAANAFPHKYVQNKNNENGHQSGTLSQHAIVTQNEMLEHSFYHILNLWQALYLHLHFHFNHFSFLFDLFHFNDWQHDEQTKMYDSKICYSFLYRIGAIVLVTSPWFFRNRFPIHSFSDNWKQTQTNTYQQNHSKIKKDYDNDNNDNDNDDAQIRQRLSHTKKNIQKIYGSIKHYNNNNKTKSNHHMHEFNVEIWLYQIKKWQYIFYKHVLFHGINITTLFPIQNETRTIKIKIPIVLSPQWRIYWIALNTSYVFEFFLQTLVKRKKITQWSMLYLQRLLMTASTIAALDILLLSTNNESSHISFYGCIYLAIIALCSMLLNFRYRGHDVQNTVILTICISIWKSFHESY